MGLRRWRRSRGRYCELLLGMVCGWVGVGWQRGGGGYDLRMRVKLIEKL